MPSVSLPGTDPFTPLSARLWRALPCGADPLSPAPSAEGRFHHAGQRAIYLSPSRKAAERATARQTAPRAAVLTFQSYQLTARRIADLRDPAFCAALDLSPEYASRPWRSERIAGRPASSWRISDAARSAGCEGLIWTARNAPHLWHLVLFTWDAQSLRPLP